MQKDFHFLFDILLCHLERNCKCASITAMIKKNGRTGHGGPWMISKEGCADVVIKAFQCQAYFAWLCCSGRQHKAPQEQSFAGTGPEWGDRRWDTGEELDQTLRNISGGHASESSTHSFVNRSYKKSQGLCSILIKLAWAAGLHPSSCWYREVPSSDHPIQRSSSLHHRSVCQFQQEGMEETYIYQVFISKATVEFFLFVSIHATPPSGGVFREP